MNRRKIAWLVAVLVAAAGSRAAEEDPSAVPIGGRTSLVFADPSAAAAVLSASDDFTRAMSPFDRAARMHQAATPSEADLLAHLGRQALPWSASEVRLLSEIGTRLRPKLEPFAGWLPERVLLVKSTDRVEDGAPHTRQTAIVLPEAALVDSRGLEPVLVHELFHLITRAHPDVRDALYARIGFTPCRPLSLPSTLRESSITNPDAPRSEHAIRVLRSSAELSVVPVLQASPRRYDASAGKSLFQYLELRFLPVERSEGRCTPLLQDERLQTFGIAELSGFFEQVGRNTQYIIHPEEILADNFAIAVLGSERVATPSIPEALKAGLLR